MCGQSGIFIATGTIEKEIELARRLMALNFLRGEHSCGLMDFVPKPPKGTTAYMFTKSTMDPLQFIANKFDKNWRSRWDKRDVRVIATHCRYATKGKISTANAHPFNFKGLLGMHNGTIKEAFPNSDKFETDSEAFYYNLSQSGLEEALSMIKDKDAAFAFVWMDLKEHTLNFLRNSKRPLSYTHIKEQPSTLAWSSEMAHLTTAIDSLYAGTSAGKAMSFVPYRHYKLHLDAKLVKFEEKDYSHLQDTPAPVTTTTHYPGTYTGGFVAYKDAGENSLTLPKRPIPNPYTLLDFANDMRAYRGCLKLKRDGWSNTVQWRSREGGYFDKPTSAYMDHLYDRMIVFRSKTTVSEKELNDAIPFDERLKNNARIFLGTKYTGGTKSVPAAYPSPIKQDGPTLLLQASEGAAGDNRGGTYSVGPGFRKAVSVARYRDILRTGCACCGNESHLGDTVIFTGDTEYLCEGCSERVVQDKGHWLRKEGVLGPHAIAQIEADVAFLEKTFPPTCH